MDTREHLDSREHPDSIKVFAYIAVNIAKTKDDKFLDSLKITSEEIDQIKKHLTVCPNCASLAVNDLLIEKQWQHIRDRIQQEGVIDCPGDEKLTEAFYQKLPWKETSEIHLHCVTCQQCYEFIQKLRQKKEAALHD